MKTIRKSISALSVLILSMTASAPAQAQHLPVPIIVKEALSGRIVGAIETKVESNGDRTETWYMLNGQYPNSALRFHETSAAELRATAQAATLQVAQRMEYLPPPNNSAISSYPSQVAAVREPILRSEAREFVLKRKSPTGQDVIEGALYRETVVTRAGEHLVRDTWRLFGNYQFPQGVIELVVAPSTTAASATVGGFLKKHSRQSGSWVILRDLRGVSLGGSSDPEGDGI